MKKSRKPSTAPRHMTLERQVNTVGRDLARSFSNVIGALPGAPHRPQRLAKSLGVNTVLTSRILKAAQQRDPMAVAHIIPGPEPLRRLLNAAERLKVDPDLIREARQAVDRFQHLIDAEAGDRSALDALISGWLPDAREKVELIAKQSVFRGVSQLLGAACEVVHCTNIVYPSQQSTTRADVICIMATYGLRRLRPGLPVEYDSIHADSSMLTLSGQPIEGLHGLLLEQFCSKPLPQMEVSRVGNIAQYTLSGDDVGVQSAVTLVHATYLPNRKDLYRSATDGPRQATSAIGTSTAARTLIFDVFLHDAVYPARPGQGDRTPTLGIYRTAGVFNDRRAPARRAGDRLQVIESIQPLGSELSKFRAAEVPEYQDLIQFVCEMRNWDANSLRGYRCRIEYPMYSSEVVMAFEMPERDGA